MSCVEALGAGTNAVEATFEANCPSQINPDTPDPLGSQEMNRNTQMRMERQQSDSGGCMQVFQMVLQIVAAVLMVIPQTAAIGTALMAASRGMAAATGNGASATASGNNGVDWDLVNEIRGQRPQHPMYQL
jgi:hypothetical protein